MVTASVQDRTAEFRAVLAQAQKRQAAIKGAQRPLLTESQKRAANGNGETKKGARSVFARRAAEIGRGITRTMEKLERLAQRNGSPRPCHGSVLSVLVARRKTLFDDRPQEIGELTYVIKQDLSALNSQISSLQSLSKSQHAQVSRSTNVDQEGEHNKNVRARTDTGYELES